MAETLAEGGWYRADLIPEHLTLLSFNSLQFNASSETITEEMALEKVKELRWLESQLENAKPTEKFLI